MRIDSAQSSNASFTGSFSGSFTGTAGPGGLTADAIEFSNILNKPTLLSGSAQVTYSSESDIPTLDTNGKTLNLVSSDTSIEDGDVVTELNFFGKDDYTASPGAAKSAAIITKATIDWGSNRYNSAIHFQNTQGTGVTMVDKLIIAEDSIDFKDNINIDDTTASTSTSTGAVVIDGGVGIAGDLFVGGDITAYASSDRRLKENIFEINNVLDKVQKMGGYTFDWKEGMGAYTPHTGHDIGVVAQEVQEQFPELVEERDNGYLAVNYVKLTAILLQAVKELSNKVAALEKN